MQRVVFNTGRLGACSKDRAIVEKKFDYSHIYVRGQEIWVVVYRQQGRLWCPFGGGPLKDQAAVDHCQWLRSHIEEFRSILPKRMREWPIKIGECQSSNGDVYEMQPTPKRQPTGVLATE